MQSKATTPEQYINEVTDERRKPFQELRNVIIENLPKGFVEVMNYGMIGYVVPHTIFPDGYHCNPTLPLPFINLASQKNYIALYHMGMYSNPELLNWFKTEYTKHYKHKLDMGKSCIRFKKIEQIPYELIGELVQKISPEEWIKEYKNSIL